MSRANSKLSVVAGVIRGFVSHFLPFSQRCAAGGNFELISIFENTLIDSGVFFFF